MNRSKVVLGLRLFIGVAVIAIVVVAANSTELHRALLSLQGGYVALAVAVQLVAKLVWARRWQLLLRAVHVHFTFWDLLQLIHVGLFVNWFLPGSVGGDVARGHLSRGHHGAHAAYAVVLGERIIGLVTLLTLSLTGSIVIVCVDPDKLAVLGSVALLSVAAIGGCCAVWWMPYERMPLLTTALRSRKAWVSHVDQFLARFRGVLRLDIGYVWRVTVLSYALHLLGIYFHFMCARSASLSVGFLDLMVVVPVSVVVAMLPVTINGLGVREGVLVGMLLTFGVTATDAAAFALLTLAINAIYSVIGGIILVLRRDLAFAP